MISLFLLTETASRELCLRWIQIHQRRQLKAVMAVSHQKQGGLINTTEILHCWCNLQACSFAGPETCGQNVIQRYSGRASPRQCETFNVSEM